MLSTGIEQTTLRSLTRRSNQLSYAAAQNYHNLLYKQTLSDKSAYSKKRIFVTNLHQI